MLRLLRVDPPKKGEILCVGDITIAHRIKPDCLDKIVWDGIDWVIEDPEENLSDELVVKWPSTEKGVGDPFARS